MEYHIDVYSGQQDSGVNLATSCAEIAWIAYKQKVTAFACIIYSQHGWHRRSLDIIYNRNEDVH